MFGKLFKNPVATPSAPPGTKVLYVSTERAVGEVRRAAQTLAAQLATMNDFLSFVQGPDGDKELRTLFATAFDKGESALEGYLYGQVWPTDLNCVEMFTDAAAKAGFSVVYHKIDSDGPEADRYRIVVRPMGGGAR